MPLKENLKRLRKQNKVSQRELARISGLSFSMVSKLESGEQSNPSLDTIERISAALNVQTYELMGWEETFNPNGELATDSAFCDAISRQYGKEAVILLQDYATLNETGQKKAVSYIEDLTEHPKYLKEGK